MEFEINNKVPSDWSIKSIDDVCQKITSGGTPSRRKLEFYKNGIYPWVKTKELENGWIRETEEYITEEALNNSSAKLLPKNTVLLAMYGATVGELGILASEMTCNQACCAMIVDPDQADYRYLFYLFFSQKEKIKTLATGAAQQNLSATQIKSFRLPFPDIDTQKNIAKIIGNLDEKIELNRQINQTLEQIAQAIFKSWFVDFEPVKAKIKAKQNGQDPERAAMCAISGKTDEELDQLSPDQRQQLTTTAAFFPDELEDSELGEIPKGWEISNIGNEFDVTMGQSPPGDTYNETGEGVPFFQGRRDFGWRYPVNRVYCTAPKRLAKEGDTLLSVRAPVGDVNKAISDCCIGRGISALRHKSGCEAYTYYSIQRLDKYFSNFDSEGTVFGSINQKDLKGFKTMKLTNIAFTSIVGSMDDEIRTLEEQTRNLTKIRDSLLSKLLAGKICINYHESVMEDAV